MNLDLQDIKSASVLKHLEGWRRLLDDGVVAESPNPRSISTEAMKNMTDGLSAKIRGNKNQRRRLRARRRSAWLQFSAWVQSGRLRLTSSGGIITSIVATHEAEIQYTISYSTQK